MSERAFSFISINERQYTPLGLRHLEDSFATIGDYVDSLKFAGGTFALLQRIIDLAHRRNVEVSTGGFIERVLTFGKLAVARYIEQCREFGFDTIEISSGFITLPTGDWCKLIEQAERAGLQARPEIGIQFGSGASSAAEPLPHGRQPPSP